MANITAVTQQKYQVGISNSSGNTIIADEPIEKGGDNTGLSPQELLAASLASCTLVTLRMYAERKQWYVENIEIKINVTWDAEAGATAITRTIHFFGNLDEAQKSRLMKVADSCTIHKILTHPITITTSEI